MPLADVTPDEEAKTRAALNKRAKLQVVLDEEAEIQVAWDEEAEIQAARDEEDEIWSALDEGEIQATLGMDNEFLGPWFAWGPWCLPGIFSTINNVYACVYIIYVIF